MPPGTADGDGAKSPLTNQHTSIQKQKQEVGALKMHSHQCVQVHTPGCLLLLGEVAVEGSHTLLEAEGRRVKLGVKVQKWK